MIRSLRGLWGAACMAVLMTAGGCMGPAYEPFRAGEITPYGKDLLGTPPEGYRYRVRGRIVGDLDGTRNDDGKAQNEEALLVTLHRTEQNASDTAEALLVICRVVGKKQERQLITRELVFSAIRKDLSGALPQEIVAITTPMPIQHGGIRLQDVNGDGRHEIIVSVWHDTNPGVRALHRAYVLDGGKLREIFSCAAAQAAPAVEFRDANGDGKAEAFIPARLFPDAGDKSPLWHHVFSPDKDGIYRQDNAAFAATYDKTLVSLFEHLCMPQSDEEIPAALCYYIGTIYSYRGDFDKARRMLTQAAGAGGAFGARSALRLKELPAAPAKP